MVGPAVGIAQWLVLQPHLWHAGRWVLASVVGWIVGWTVTIAIGTVVPAMLNNTLPFGLGSLAAGAISGAVYAAVAGYRLARLLRTPLLEA